MNFKKHLVALAACAILMPGLAGAAPLRFDFEGENSTGSITGFFEITSEATGTPTGGTLESHTFAASALTDFQATTFDSGGVEIDSFEVVASPAPATIGIQQVRVNFNLGVPVPGSNSFNLTGSGFPPPVVSTTTGNSANLAFSLSEFDDFSFVPTSTSNVLFDDASSLLNTAATSGFNLADFETADITLGGINFGLTSLAVTDLTPPPDPDPGVVPLPAAGWLLIAGLAGLAGIGRRRRA